MIIVHASCYIYISKVSYEIEKGESKSTIRISLLGASTIKNNKYVTITVNGLMMEMI